MYDWKNAVEWERWLHEPKDEKENEVQSSRYWGQWTPMLMRQEINQNDPYRVRIPGRLAKSRKSKGE